MAYQKDISAILGLSISTVSRALKGYPDISEETRRKVLQTAEELDYRSGRRGDTMASARRPAAVGVMAPDFEKLMDSAYYREMLCGMAAEASRERKDLVIMGLDPEKTGMSSVGRATGRKVDGICLMASKEDLREGRFSELLSSSIPVISLENHIAGYTAICRDNREDGRQLLRYLKDRGHLRTAYIGDLSLESKKQANMLDEEAKELEMGCKETTVDDLVRTADKSGALGAGITCVICDEGRTAEKVIQTLALSGIRVPEDISVVSLQSHAGECGQGGITCLINSPQKMGGAAVRKLIHIIEHPETDIGESVYVRGRVNEGCTVRDLV